MKHRKLFPTAINETFNCPDFCDPSTCPYGCYAYPYYYYLPPPPPPPPQPPHSKIHLPTYAIILVSVLAAFFLLITYYAIIVKYCSRWNRIRPPQTQSEGPDEEFLDENHRPPIDHPVWYITTIGLQPSIINSITVFKYKKGDPLIESTDCSVCLSEFHEDDTLRLLPKCNHAFHIPCIDTWLSSHTNCPLCRAGIVPTTASPPSNEQAAFDSRRNGESQIVNVESDGELRNIPNLVNDSENRVETEDEVALTQVDEHNKGFDHSKETVNCTGYRSLRAVLDLDDENLDNGGELSNIHNLVNVSEVCENRVGTEDEVELSQVNDHNKAFGQSKDAVNCIGHRSLCAFLDLDDENVDEIQQVRRSVSMELLSCDARDGANSRSNRVVNSSSVAQSLHMSPVSMKRSFSCGSRLFLSRHSQSQSSIFHL